MAEKIQYLFALALLNHDPLQCAKKVIIITFKCCCTDLISFVMFFPVWCVFLNSSLHLSHLHLAFMLSYISNKFV